MGAVRHLPLQATEERRITDALLDLAPSLGSFRRALVENGFSEEGADRLAGVYLAFLLRRSD